MHLILAGETQFILLFNSSEVFMLLNCVNPSAFNLQVGDDRAVIPRNSLIEVNQSGLVMETKIDITPLDPIPTPSVGPLDQYCAKEVFNCV